MRWPFVETELQNSNVVGWLTPIFTVAACYYVGDTVLAGAFLILGVVAGALLLTRRRRPWWQQVVVFLWSIAPIVVVALELRATARFDDHGRTATSTHSPRH